MKAKNSYYSQSNNQFFKYSHYNASFLIIQLNSIIDRCIIDVLKKIVFFI